ncbi:oligopeptide ABC transporter permease [Paenibacillus sp. UMB4589-SE434]|uniref:oligopeptide ABC transporter permease n=1 Tax=Paenibacillus sp. UMB4589-SE434 TaxID=3046314 RepID=UPI00254ACCD8|nr:oligopeptide ABC transporter permease [Paenibacillus sp. UMB4589-SE434]MDK8179920.1 ABC transporter permease [Paenibacillus sp. UMB4589-SE434]
MSVTKLSKLSWQKEVPASDMNESSEQADHVVEKYVSQIKRKFFKHKMAVWGCIITLLLLSVGLLAPWLAPYQPNEVTASFSAPPSLTNWLGTDQVGRDVLSRLIYGMRISLLIGFITVIIYVIFGSLIGMLAGYFGGWLDTLIMRITDIFLSFPYMLVVLVIVSVLGADVFTIILVLALFKWPTLAMLVRSSVMSIKQTDYVRASITLGYSTPRILFRHILPNAAAPIIVNATFGIAGTILSEAGLSFLGMGIKSPQASLGNMLHDAQSLTVLTEQPWLWVPAGVVILMIVLSFNFVGDGLRDALDAKA